MCGYFSSQQSSPTGTADLEWETRMSKRQRPIFLPSTNKGAFIMSVWEWAVLVMCGLICLQHCTQAVERNTYDIIWSRQPKARASSKFLAGVRVSSVFAVPALVCILWVVSTNVWKRSLGWRTNRPHTAVSVSGQGHRVPQVLCLLHLSFCPLWCSRCCFGLLLLSTHTGWTT